MTSAWDDARRALADAAHWFVDTVTLVGDRWEEPGLGEWDVSSLVGHTSRALLTVEAYLEQPAELARVRRDDRGRPALGERVEPPRVRVEPVGVEDDGHLGAADELARGRGESVHLAGDRDAVFFCAEPTR